MINSDIVHISLLSDTMKPDFSHGTKMVGVITAKPSDNDGLIGIAPASKIYSIQVVDDSGACSPSILANAIRLATELDVDIISISLGTTSKSDELANAVEQALSAGIIIVFATRSMDLTEELYPASYHGVLKVIPVDKKGNYIYSDDNPLNRLYVKTLDKV